MPPFGTAVKCVLRTSFHHRSQMLRAALYSTKVVDCRLEALIPESARERGVETRREVVEHDEPAAGICRAAERFNADLICMESRGRSRCRELHERDERWGHAQEVLCQKAGAGSAASHG